MTEPSSASRESTTLVSSAWHFGHRIHLRLLAAPPTSPGTSGQREYLTHLNDGTAVALDPVDVPLYGVEPESAADTAASLLAKERITHLVPDTICDGLRAVVGVPNFAIIAEHVLQVLTVSDAQCRDAQALVAEQLGSVIEPSSATVLAAVLANPALFTGKRIGLILTGGNV